MLFELHHAHPWKVSPKEAVAIQRELSSLVREDSLRKPVETIAGVDVSVRGGEVQTAIVVLRLPGFEVLDEVTWRGDVQFPYVPGLLSFREVPAILPALEKLTVRPDVFMTDSQGLAHPRRFGLACHLGVLLDWPTLGVAKTLLTGMFEPPSMERGSRSPLIDRGEVVGSVVRTRAGVRPVFVSIGHRLSLADAVDLSLASSARYRIPEPTRLAHHLSRSKSQP